MLFNTFFLKKTDTHMSARHKPLIILWFLKKSSVLGQN